MKSLKFVIQVFCFLQLVYVIAGNDVITFNQEVFDEDNIDTALETEHFIHVVDRRGNKPLHNTAVKTPTVHQNVFLDLSSQNSILKDHRNPVQTQITSHPSNTSFSKTSRTPSESWTPVHWEDLSRGGNSENDLLDIDDFLTSEDHNSHVSLSRHERAVLTSGDQAIQGQFNLVESGRGKTDSNMNMKAIADSLDKYLKNYFRPYKIEASVTDIKVRTVHFEIVYDDEKITNKDIARALYALDKTNNFLVGSIAYDVSLTQLTDLEANRLQAVICFLCSDYQKCSQGLNLDFFCILNDPNFFPFGWDRSDKTIPPDREFATARIRLQYAIPFDRELVDTIFISPNGIISFGEEFASYSPVPCPVFNYRLGKYRKILAPYWTDLDVVTGDLGEVFYQVHTENGGRNDQDILRRASNDVMRYSNERSFVATLAIKITWSDMPAYPVIRGKEERVNFQAVIVSDGETTYVIYFYGHGAMKLNPYRLRKVQVFVNNINLDVSRNNFYQFDRVIGNTGRVGHWIYKLGYVPNYASKCYQWFQSNVPILNGISNWNQIIPACPCTEFGARLSFQWIPSYLQFGCYDSFPQFGQVGRRCCYTTPWGSFENRMPLSGNLQMFNPYYYFSAASHERYDAAPKEWCCYRSNLCHLYYAARPVRACQPRITWRGFFFGDPHLSTLDKQNIIFNGLGEYRLLEVNTTVNNETHVDFRLQGRTCRATESDGSLSNATVFCALALLNTNKTSIQVSIDQAHNFMIIFVNNQDFTVRFRDSENFNTSVGDMYVRRMNESLVVSTPDDIGVTITLVDSLLDFSVEIGVQYRNTTKGLLGNFNGDPADDFIYPNGTTLPNTTSERDVFEYCQTWAVKESIFSYAPGENSSTHSDPTFVPIFLGEANATVKAEAEKICGGNSKQSCIYDYIATRNAQLAMNTKDSDNSYDKVEKILANSPPIIHGSNLLHVIVNVPSNLTLTGSDPDNDTFYFIVVHNTSSGKFEFTNSSTELSMRYTPFNSEKASIEVSALDSQGQRSETIQIRIVVCNGCSGEKNQGQCNFTNLINNTDPFFALARCECEFGYSGENCGEDEDGCSIDPCPEGTNCTDVKASEVLQINATFTCSSCPVGYYMDSNTSKCEDIDECNSAPDPCANAECVNQIGDYTCICNPGFRNSGKKCEDINECVENQHDCKQICINQVPSSQSDLRYLCDCYDGFKLINISSCIETNTDPCENLNNPLNCSTGCRNNSGKAECFCEIGYRLKADGYTCEDIDECKEKLCSQDCTNNNGSYICSCFKGYQLSEDKLSCTLCPDNKHGIGCKEDCNCHGHATKCDPVQGCICTEAWTGSQCDIDVNECETLVNPCAKDKICSNTNGSFTCDCPIGYEDVNGTCTNINECLSAAVHNCSQNCTDNPGSFACSCQPGYKADGRFCEDIDECALGISECGQICRNMEGSYNCECHPGFVLDASRKNCSKASDPCQDFNVSCSHICDIVDNSPQCFCPIGYMLGTDNKTCIDINECTSGHNCASASYCKNTAGSYECSCPAGEKLASDFRNCSACDGYHWGLNCANVCGCDPVGTETCDPVIGCKCKTGWYGKKCSIDKDECSLNGNVCPGNSTCRNTPGSYVCQCRDGFMLSNTSCIDIDECISTKPCDHNCKNTIGSYTCSCQEGFLASGDKCVDIDECALPLVSKCDQRCRNTQGGFACECFGGYVLNTTTRNTCYRDPKAQSCGDAKNCSYDCALEDGQEMCFCPPGFELETYSKCEDIDECKNSPCVNGNCTNLNGSFVCDCNDGEKLALDQLTCQACEYWKYGKDCSSPCLCNMTNTAECLPSNGTCVCNDGWNGTTCTDDINECDNSSMCVTNAECQNTPGSFKCVCEVGYFPTSDGECVQCDDTHYGQDCTSVCSCSTANTQDCDHINGTCTCMPGWNGTNCEIDVNECTENTSDCGSHEYCHNRNGSFECLCDSGYDRPNPTDPCQDINECLDLALQNCTDPRECNNTDGAFDCICKKGYLEIGGQCKEGQEFIVQITLDYNDDQIKTFGNIFNSTSEDFKAFAKLVKEALLNFSRPFNVSTLLDVKITEFRNGSIIAYTHMYIDKNSDNPPGDAATVVDELHRKGSIVINNMAVGVKNVKIGNTTVTNNICDTFKLLGGNCTMSRIKCDPKFKECISKATPEGNKTNLIIGLAVGIPLFIILTIIVALLAYLYVRRKRTSQEQSSSQSVDHASQFRNVVATRTSTKGSWGAPHQMYAPDNFSDTGTNESGNGGLMKTRQKGRSDFQDSAWYDNRGATSSGLPDSREASTETGGPMSNFSWEYMFRLLEPHKDFEIQRPFCETEPNPTFTPSNQ